MPSQRACFVALAAALLLSACSTTTSLDPRTWFSKDSTPAPKVAEVPGVEARLKDMRSGVSGTVYVRGYMGRNGLFALDEHTGEIRWSPDTEFVGDHVVLDGDKIFRCTLVRLYMNYDLEFDDFPSKLVSWHLNIRG